MSTSNTFDHAFSARITSRLARALAVCSALAMVPSCDSKDDSDDATKSGATKDEISVSKQAARVDAEVAKMKDKLGKDEDIKYACAGSLAQFEALATSSNEADKKSYAAMQQVCHVDLPKALIADLRKKIESGEELKTSATVNLQTVLNNDKFPADGEAAKVAADAKKLMDVEIPAYHIEQHLKTAAEEKEAGKKVSMGCIKAKQVIDKSKAPLEADEGAKTVLVKYSEACAAT